MEKTKTNIILRVDVKRKEDYEKAAASAGSKDLSKWIRGLLDAAADGIASPAPKTAKAPAAEQKQVPFNPSGPEVVAVAVKARKSKKAPVLPAVIEIEAATVTRKVVEQVPVAAPLAPLTYTGESSCFNGLTMYEHVTDKGKRWTKEPPKGK